MTSTAPRKFLIQGRDYEWVASTDDNVHSFCYLRLDDGDFRVAAIKPNPEPGLPRWCLLWGPDEYTTDPNFPPSYHRYLLDCHDAVAKGIQPYVEAHPETYPL